MDKTQKTALITGATSGIGRATANMFAANGWNIIITGRRAERLAALAATLKTQHQVEVLELCFDVRNREAVFQSLETIPTAFRKVDVLVNNAGLAAGRDPIDTGSVDDWDQMMDTNVKGLLYVSHKVIDWMKTNGTGHIVNIGSTAGKEVYKDGGVYCASKFAVDAITKSMRIDLLEYGIKVTGINPGMVETEFSLVRFKGDESRAASVYQGFDALQAEDIADIVWFAVSRPARVGINDIVVTPAAQANSYYTVKRG
jgi:NADP-dependent 3-hydroxy acid dehydrogenase YdfG